MQGMVNISERAAFEGGGVDQGIHNVLVQSAAFKWKDDKQALRLPLHQSPVFTAGHAGEHELERVDGIGRFYHGLSHDSEPPAILHQFDRMRCLKPLLMVVYTELLAGWSQAAREVAGTG
jgi:hypothetical protein